MSEPDLDKEQGNPDSSFDFLEEDAANRPARSANRRLSRQLEMPIIRKPVPISESGPMRVGVGSVNTNADEDLDNFDFLSDNATDDATGPKQSHGLSDDWNEGMQVAPHQTEKSPVGKVALLFAGLLIAGGAVAYYFFSHLN